MLNSIFFLENFIRTLQSKKEETGIKIELFFDYFLPKIKIEIEKNSKIVVSDRESFMESVQENNLELANLWGKCLNFLEKHPKINTTSFENWIKPIKAVNFSKEKGLILKAPSEYFASYVMENLAEPLNDLLESQFSDEADLVFEYPESLKTSEANHQGRQIEKIAEENYVCPISKLHNFSTFYESPSNQMVRKIAEAVAISPKEQASSLVFIHGASGVGKTHLAQAMAQLIMEVHPNLKVAYVPSNRFELQYIHDARKDGKANFLRFYQNVDVLILDDIQGIMGKNKTQLAFFEIFNHLYLSNKQIILTSDIAPAQFSGLEDRILTRLQSALILELKRPDFELRCKYLSEHAKARSILLEKEQIEYIAKSLTRNMRELLGLINYLDNVAKYLGCTAIDQEMIQNGIRQIVGKVAPETPNMDRIQKVICKEYQIDITQLLSKNRKSEIAIPRQILMYLTKKLTDLSFPAIGGRLKRNHTTVMHGCKAIEENMESNPEFKSQVMRLEDMILSPDLNID